MFKRFLLIIASLFFLSGVQANEVDWKKIDQEKSELKATFKQYDIPVSGNFKQFSGKVFFNPQQLSQTRAQLVVKTASYDLGDEMYNEEVAGEDWFFSGRYPDAVFALTHVDQQADNLLAIGSFKLRGVNQEIRFPVNVASSANFNTFTGQFTIKRLKYGVGQGDWADEALVDDDVKIEFKIVVPK